MSSATAPPGESTAVISEKSTIEAPIAVPGDILYEVVDGQIKEKLVGASEIEIASILVQLMGPFARDHRLGKVLAEMIFRIDRAKDLQRRPDVAFVSHSKWPFNRRVPNVSVWDMAPDLAIEVVSPTNTAVEVQAKVQEYFEAGVSGVWVIYPKQKQIYIYASPTQIQVVQLGEELEGGNLLPGFRLPLRALFEDDPE